MPVEDYYSLIGVSADADRDAIKDAYRVRRSELDDSEAGKQNAARLNRAWNVLSDTAQRERYDDELATARAEGDEVIVPELVAAAPSTAGMSKAQARRAAAKSRQVDRPIRQARDQESEINGVALAANRDRVFSLMVDIFISFLVLFVGVNLLTLQLGGKDLADSVKAADKAVVAQKKVTDKATDAADKASDAVTEAKKGNDQAKTDSLVEAEKAAKARAKTEKAKFDELNKALDKEQSKYTPYYQKLMVAGGVVLFLLFGVPSATSGRTPGKALRKLRLVNEDGSRVTWKTVAIRYGAVLGFITLTGAFLGGVAQIAWIVAVFGVSSFTRSPTRQGWHDRLAKTRVVQG